MRSTFLPAIAAALSTFATVAAAQEAPRVGGTLITTKGGIYVFEYVGDVDGRTRRAWVEGEWKGDSRRVYLEDTQEITLERSGQGTIAHVTGVTGARLTLDNADTNTRANNGNWSGLKLVHIDDLSGKRKSEHVYDSVIATIQVGRPAGRFRWNPRTQRHYPSWYDFDPIDGSRLSWTDESPPSPALAPATIPTRFEDEDARQTLMASILEGTGLDPDSALARTALDYSSLWFQPGAREEFIVERLGELITVIRASKGTP